MLDSKTSIGISETEDWQRISVTVTVPESTRTMRIKCSVKNTTGTAWFDCLQLEEGNCANDLTLCKTAILKAMIIGLQMIKINFY